MEIFSTQETKKPFSITCFCIKYEHPGIGSMHLLPIGEMKLEENGHPSQTNLQTMRPNLSFPLSILFFFPFSLFQGKVETKGEVLPLPTCSNMQEKEDDQREKKNKKTIYSKRKLKKKLYVCMYVWALQVSVASYTHKKFKTHM